MSSYICPQCHTRGPALLRAGQVCQGCKSARAWAQFGGDNQVIIIDQAPEPSPTLLPRTSNEPTGYKQRAAWLSLCAALSLTLVAATLLLLFFRDRDAVPSEDFFFRLNTLSTWAAIAGVLAVLISIGSSLYARHKGYTKKVVLRYSGLAIILLSVGISVTAVSFQSMTGKIQALPPIATDRADPTIQQLHNATVALHVFNKAVNPYRPAEGMGVVIAAKSGHIWVLTVPYSKQGAWQSLQSSDAVWVSFADGRSLAGQVRWVAPPHVNLAVVEVAGDGPPPGVASIYPIPEGLIPSCQVLSIPNPARSGWVLQQGMVLARQSIPTKLARHCFVQTDLDANPEDIGSGLYSRDGRLMGLNAERPGQRQGAQYVIVTSEIMRSILAAVESGDFDSLQDLSFEVIPS